MIIPNASILSKEWVAYLEWEIRQLRTVHDTGKCGGLLCWFCTMPALPERPKHSLIDRMTFAEVRRQRRIGLRPDRIAARETVLRIISSHASEERRSRYVSAMGRCTVEQWMARVEYFGWLCVYCRKTLTPKTLTKDHAIPLSRGGSNWPSNLVPACKSCNSKKKAKKPNEFSTKFMEKMDKY